MFFLYLGLFFICMNSSSCKAMNPFCITSVKQTKNYTCYEANKMLLGVAYPSNDTVLLLSDGCWSTFDPNTRLLKKFAHFRGKIEDFGVHKKELVVATLVDSFLFNLETSYQSEVIYTDYKIKRIAFFPYENTIAIWSDDSISLIDKNYTSRFIREVRARSYDNNCLPMLVARPKSNDLLVLNVAKKNNNPNSSSSKYGYELVHMVINHSQTNYIKKKKTIKDDLILSAMYNPKGTVLAIQSFVGYEFYKIDTYHDYKSYLIISPNKNKKVVNPQQIMPYSAIAFHPYRLIVALMNRIDNKVEFHHYANKVKNTLITTIALNKSIETSDKFAFNKHIAFSRDGKTIVAIHKGDNKFYMIPIPLCAYYDMPTINKCIFLNFILNNYASAPQDIKKLIFNIITYSKDIKEYDWLI